MSDVLLSMGFTDHISLSTRWVGDGHVVLLMAISNLSLFLWLMPLV